MILEKWLNLLSYYDLFTITVFFLIENLLLMLLAILIGKLIEPNITKIKQSDIKWVISTLICNTIVTIIGYKLYQYQIIKINFSTSFFTIVFDTLLLIFLMDFFMFCFHFLAHKLTWFRPIHQLHHTHIETNVYSLFVLNPIETLGFGTIWLIIISILEFNCVSIILYLILNLSYGILGHLNKDIYPKFWNVNVVTKWISTTQFHSNHHKNESHNFGFYFTIWDKIFKTII
ncbi:sterol desaturase family protein [Flavobacterium sp. LS1R49]|uniref:Sterol desaturase family protein n=1 Tax=Flavobacterium shii TaxID=2987687 RepID=A0A9X2ZDB7_9FLAO|nr:sterol desaturase family protein [Flavobacterium shii]MCV9926447.1 sterol desaturase family protein [Flavobacterium shii]